MFLYHINCLVRLRSTYTFRIFTVTEELTRTRAHFFETGAVSVPVGRKGHRDPPLEQFGHFDHPDFLTFDKFILHNDLDVINDFFYIFYLHYSFLAILIFDSFGLLHLFLHDGLRLLYLLFDHHDALYFFQDLSHKSFPCHDSLKLKFSVWRRFLLFFHDYTLDHSFNWFDNGPGSIETYGFHDD